MPQPVRADPGRLLFGFPPLAAPGARILILGSMPGARSLSDGHYYAHPRNHFWPILGALLGFDPALPYAPRCQRLTAARVALWDVLAQCRRPGSLDRAIARETATANDFPRFLAGQPHLRAIFFNGGEAERLFRRLVLPSLPAPPSPDPWVLTRLPSTSPAHAGQSLATKLAAWQAVRHALTPLEETDHDRPPE